AEHVGLSAARERSIRLERRPPVVSRRQIRGDEVSAVVVLVGALGKTLPQLRRFARAVALAAQRTREVVSYAPHTAARREGEGTLVGIERELRLPDREQHVRIRALRAEA